MYFVGFFQSDNSNTIGKSTAITRIFCYFVFYSHLSLICCIKQFTYTVDGKYEGRRNPSIVPYLRGILFESISHYGRFIFQNISYDSRVWIINSCKTGSIGFTCSRVFQIRRHGTWKKKSFMEIGEKCIPSVSQ